MTEEVYIVDEMKLVAEKVKAALLQSLGPVYFMYGHIKEITGRLQRMTNAQNKKFPLIVLFTDIKISRKIPGYYGKARLRMLIITNTDRNYTAEERTEKSFKPILHPIKRVLIEQIYRHKMFSFTTRDFYDETDMYFYGSLINDKNIFNDYIDAIELNDIEITIHNRICSPKNNLKWQIN